MSEELVYVLGTPGSATVKIGRTTNLRRRLADIRHMSPVPLAILWTHPGGRELEGNLHRYFAKLRSHGEWFTFQDDPVEAVSQAVRDDNWPEPRRPKSKSVSATKRVTRRKAPLSGARQRTPRTQSLPLGFRDGLTCAFVAAAEHLTAGDIQKMVDMVVTDLEDRLSRKRLRGDAMVRIAS